MSDLSTSRCARLAIFAHTDQFALVAEQLVADLRDEGLDFSSLSVYLLDRQTRKGRNYYFCPQPVGYCESSFDEGMAPLAALLQNQPRMWQDPHAPHPLWYLTVPSLTGAAEVANGRAFNQRERDLLSSQVDFLLLLVNRHRELESIERQTSQSTHIDLVVNALMNFPTMRSVDTPSQGARRIVEFIVDYLPYDRAGIFLVDGAYLRGTWGVDQDGRIASIAHTAFPLKNSHPEQFSEAALIALGKLDYFLTQDLDGAAARSTEGNIGANLAVPLRLEGHIMGVLSVDNSFSRHSILEYQVQPLLLLATQAAAAIGITRLRTGTDSKQKISAKTDDGTRPSSAPRKDASAAMPPSST